MRPEMFIRPRFLAHFSLVAALLAGCAADPRYDVSIGMTSADVGARVGKPVASGRLPGGEEYWDYSSQPFGYTIQRVTFAPDGRVREVRNLLTEQNFAGLRAGMTPDEVMAVVGPSAPSERRSYGGGTKSWSYRYDDGGVKKLLHVVFDAHDRLLHHYTEWDPDVYSRGGRDHDSHGGR
jgi:outer membrane protein assembly factor BamE (lipoprotein component of BamABCDE complex)